MSPVPPGAAPLSLPRPTPGEQRADGESRVPGVQHSQRGLGHRVLWSPPHPAPPMSLSAPSCRAGRSTRGLGGIWEEGGAGVPAARHLPSPPLHPAVLGRPGGFPAFPQSTPLSAPLFPLLGSAPRRRLPRPIPDDFPLAGSGAHPRLPLHALQRAGELCRQRWLGVALVLEFFGCDHPLSPQRGILCSWRASVGAAPVQAACWSHRG